MSKLHTGHLWAGDESNRRVALLASESHRRVVAYFRDAATDVATLDELAAHAAAKARGTAKERDAEEARAMEYGDGTETSTTDRGAIHLHHAVLPELDEAGLLDYDTRTNTVRYYGHPVLDDGSLVPAFGGDCA